MNVMNAMPIIGIAPLVFILIIHTFGGLDAIPQHISTIATLM